MQNGLGDCSDPFEPHVGRSCWARSTITSNNNNNNNNTVYTYITGDLAQRCKLHESRSLSAVRPRSGRAPPASARPFAARCDFLCGQHPGRKRGAQSHAHTHFQRAHGRARASWQHTHTFRCAVADMRARAVLGRARASWRTLNISISALINWQ